MTSRKASFSYLSLTPRWVGAILLTLCLTAGAGAQGRARAVGNGTIDAGTTINVRTNEAINAKNNDGRVFSGSVDQDVASRNGSVAIPRGSAVELVVKNTDNNEVALDLGSVMINGQRFSVDTEDSVIDSTQKDGLGANGRTGKYVGGGALLGAIVGAIAGGGKGAAIGGGVGAAAGAGTQVLTRGRSVSVPSESLLTFRLQQPLRVGAAGFSNNSQRYQPGYNNNNNVNSSTNSAAFRAGMAAGRADSNRNLPRNTVNRSWTNYQQRRDYEAGYNQGYQAAAVNDNPTLGNRRYNSYGNSNGAGTVRIGNDNNISWQAPAISRVYVVVDDQPERLFAEGLSGNQRAPWIERGHSYVFVLRDLNGNQMASDRLDLR